MISSPLQLAGLTKTQPPLLPPDMLWTIALDELQHQMLHTTFNAWLLGSHLIPRASHPTFLAIAVRNPYAQAWLQHRLQPVIYRTLTAVAGYPLTLCFVAKYPIRAIPYPRPLSTTCNPKFHLENLMNDPTIHQYPCPHLQLQMWPHHPKPLPQP